MLTEVLRRGFLLEIQPFIDTVAVVAESKFFISCRSNVSTALSGLETDLVIGITEWIVVIIGLRASDRNDVGFFC